MSVISDLLPDKGETSFVFERKESPVPSSLRAERKISLILIILYRNSYREKASPLKLQLFNWALGSSEAMARLKKYVLDEEQQFKPDVIHLDPSVNRAIDLAIADDMVDIDTRGKIVLENKGRDLAKKIINSDGVLTSELQELEEISKKVSENKLEDILDGIF